MSDVTTVEGITVVGQRRAADLAHRLELSTRGAMRGRAEALRALAARLEAVAPERTLARGYSITLDEQGQPVTPERSAKPEASAKFT